jgi:hypothetical protein
MSFNLLVTTDNYCTIFPTNCISLYRRIVSTVPEPTATEQEKCEGEKLGQVVDVI